MGEQRPRRLTMHHQQLRDVVDQTLGIPDTEIRQKGHERAGVGVQQLQLGSRFGEMHGHRQVASPSECGGGSEQRCSDAVGCVRTQPRTAGG